MLTKTIEKSSAGRILNTSLSEPLPIGHHPNPFKAVSKTAAMIKTQNGTTTKKKGHEFIGFTLRSQNVNISVFLRT